MFRTILNYILIGMSISTTTVVIIKKFKNENNEKVIFEKQSENDGQTKLGFFENMANDFKNVFNSEKENLVRKEFRPENFSNHFNSKSTKNESFSSTETSSNFNRLGANNNNVNNSNEDVNNFDNNSINNEVKLEAMKKKSSQSNKTTAIEDELNKNENVDSTNQANPSEEKIYAINQTQYKTPTASSSTTSTSRHISLVNNSLDALTNSCSADIIGGSFNHPISININCSVISSIKYCVGIDSGSGCCDPHLSSQLYSSPVVIGNTNGNYCLSFYAESNLASDTENYENHYVINSTFPDLQVNHPLVYLQTGQLPSKSLVHSADFGRPEFYIGQVNLKTHNPSTEPNLDCIQIVNNYSSLVSPTPLSILSSFDVSSENPAYQIEIPLRPDNIQYGDNFITSFAINNNYVTPIYSCSTTNVVVSDFDYFSNEIVFNEPTTTSTSELTGGLSAYGFFENETQILSSSRTQIGNKTEESTGENLQSGLFGIFF